MYNENKELIEYEVEKKILDHKNEIYQENIAEQLVNKGLGEEIKQTLNRPYKITKFQLFKMRLKNIRNRIIDVL